MTTVVLGSIAALAAVTLLSVLWSIGRQIRAESAGARLRSDGVRATGTIVDNTMTSTPQSRLIFSPVVEFRTMTGQVVLAAAQQRSATSWPRGATVEVAYDPRAPERFVMAGRQPAGHLGANTLIGLLVVAIMIGTMLGMYAVWWEFRYDRADQVPPQGTSDAVR